MHHTNTAETRSAAAAHSHSRRYLLLAAGLAVALVIILVFSRKSAPAEPPPAAANVSDVKQDWIELKADQLQGLRIEPVRRISINANLDATGKITFNEDRMTPVFAPYSGRVLEVLANKGDLVKAGQSLLFLESPDLVVAEYSPIDYWAQDYLVRDGHCRGG